MRTKSAINMDMKVSVDDLNRLIEESVESEQDFEDRRKGLERHIKGLKAELSYEETPIGQIDNLVQETENKIKVLIDELEQTTGITLKRAYEPNTSYPR